MNNDYILIISDGVEVAVARSMVKEAQRTPGNSLERSYRRSLCASLGARAGAVSE